MADKANVELKEPITKRNSRHACEKRRESRLCSDLVHLAWTEGPERSRQEIGILESLSLAGVALFIGVPVTPGAPIRIFARDTCLTGAVRSCAFRDNGYMVAIDLDLKTGSGFIPEHFLDVSRLRFE